MTSKVGQYFTRKGLISKEYRYLTVRGRQPEDRPSLRGNQAFPSEILALCWPLSL